MQATQEKEVPKIDPEELNHFMDFMSDRYGLELSWYNQLSLERRIQRVLTASRLDNLTNLSLVLQRNSSYFHRFVDLFTVKVTEMFREPYSLKALRSYAFPILERLLKPKILIVGGSKGAEMISLCILLHETGLLDRSEIVVTDLSRDALEESQKFSIGKSKLSDAEKNYFLAGGKGKLEQYYHSGSTSVRFREELFKPVKWTLFDITQSELGTHFDLILCKNVLIYFHHQHQSKPLDRLVRHLRPGGVLALGEQESMAFYNNDAFLMQTLSSDYKIYRKSLQQL